MSSIPLKEYLKKYMSKDETKPKKKRKVRKNNSKLLIYDEDEVVAPAFIEDDIPDSDDDDPQIVEIGPKIEFPSNYWKTIGTETFPTFDLLEPILVKEEVLSDSAPEVTPLKRGRFGDDDISPLRRVKEEVDDDPSKKPTEVIFRDRKSLKKKDMEVERAKEEEKKKREAEIADKYALWGLGLKQLDDRIKENKSDRREIRKPLARSIEDSDLNKELKKRMLEEDPMLKFMGGSEEGEKPKMVGQRYENRYGIEPGVRWDGVDRSNGYERRFLQNMADRVAIKAVAYRIRTDDM